MSNQPNKSFPPRWADRLLEWRCPQDQLEEIQGDMHELFYQWLDEVGEKKARRRYALNVLTFLRPLPTRPLTFEQKINSYSKTNSFSMISNYLKVAWRNLQRSKVF